MHAPPVAKPLMRALVVLPIGLLVALGVATVEEFRTHPYAGFGPLSRQPLWLQTVEIYLLVDFLGYWSHRLFHGGKWWPFHAVHHSSEDLDWMSSIRVYPVNEVVGNLCRAVPVLFLGLNPLVTVSTAPVLTLYAIFLHANVDRDFGPLRSLIASPVFHRWHHSREPAAVDKNFTGLFPVWDIFFGTYYRPRGRAPANFGIHEPMPAGYLRQLAHPLTAALGAKNRSQLLALAIVSSLVGLATAEPTSEQDESQAARAWVTPAITAPGVSFHTFESVAAKATVSYHLYSPPAYDCEPERRFPVVYWLHGSGGGLPGIPKVAAHFAAAIEAGKTPPCLVVFVNGMVKGMYVDWKDGSAPVETMIIKELIPHIEATYRTIATRKGRLLDGYSMGGYGAARLGFKYPELFHAISIMGGGPLQDDLLDTPRAGRQRALEVLQRVYGGDPEYFKSVSPRVLAEQHAEAIKKGSLVRQVCGEQDETFDANRDFHEHLERLGIPHTWTVLPGVDHNPLTTLEALGDSNWGFYRQAFGGQHDSAAGNRDRTPDQTPDRVLAFNIKGQDRRAVVVNAAADGVMRPAVIVLHGGMGSAEVMRANSGFDAVARSEGFIVVYAEGTSFGGDRHAWNTGFLMRRQVQDADDIAYFDTLIDALVREHGADPDRVCMTGGSNGGMMTFVYAVARPERLAAVAPVVASMFTFDAKPSVPLPILIINGAKDDEVPLEGGMSRNPIVRRAQQGPFKPLDEVVEFWVKANRSRDDAEFETRGTVTTAFYAATPEGAATEFVVDSAGGHGWPGSKPRRQGASPITSFSGAERVWQFFRDKRREIP